MLITKACAVRTANLPKATRMNTSLRPVKDSDRPFLMDVYASTREDELKLVEWTPDQKRAFCEMQFTAQDTHYRKSYTDVTYDIVLVDGEPAGRLYVCRQPDHILILDIALLPVFRGRGIGTSLLGVVQTEATESGKPLRIHVERFNPALRLYSRLGFRLIEDKGVYLFMEWRPPDPAGEATR